MNNQQGGFPVESAYPLPAGTQIETRHTDDIAVDAFAVEMKAKMAMSRENGRGGWEKCSPIDLSRMLRECVEKGDPIDVANFCMMIWEHETSISRFDEIAKAAHVAQVNRIGQPVQAATVNVEQKPEAVRDTSGVDHTERTYDTGSPNRTFEDVKIRSLFTIDTLGNGNEPRVFVKTNGSQAREIFVGISRPFEHDDRVFPITNVSFKIEY